MSEPADTKSDRRSTFSPLRVLAVTLVAIVILISFLGPRPHSRELVNRIKCNANLHSLRAGLHIYASEYEGAYPEPEKWCDLLASYVYPEYLRCPGVEAGPCDYAMNPHADANSAGNVVLLFESRPGWNQFGGPELLTTENHEGQGCNVSFVDGTVKFVRTEELGDLRWQGRKGPAPDARNVRWPRSGKDLKYWLRNMIWYHRFSREEVRLATGLTDGEIRAAQKRFDVWPDGRPERDTAAALLVLPYPGGRSIHPTSSAAPRAARVGLRPLHRPRRIPGGAP